MGTSAVSDTGIYRFINTVKAKSYVGSAVSLRKRKAAHLRALVAGSHKNKKLQAAYDKYGADAFTFEVVEFCERFQLISREQFWIDSLDAVNGGYNLNPIAGSPLGRKFPGRQLSLKHRESISAAKRGKKRGAFSEEWRRKLSAVARRPRPKASAAIKASWEGRTAIRKLLVCGACSKTRTVTERAFSKLHASYRCRQCFLAAQASASVRNLYVLCCPECNKAREVKRNTFLADYDRLCLSCARKGSRNPSSKRYTKCEVL